MFLTDERWLHAMLPQFSGLYHTNARCHNCITHTHTHTHTVKAAAVLKYTNEHYDRVHMKSPAVL